MANLRLIPGIHAASISWSESAPAHSIIGINAVNTAPVGVPLALMVDEMKAYLSSRDYVVMTREEFEKAQTTDEDVAIEEGMAIGRSMLLRELGFEIEEDITTVEHHEDVKRAEAVLKADLALGSEQRQRQEQSKILRAEARARRESDPVQVELHYEDMKVELLRQLRSTVNNLMTRNNVTEDQIRKQVENGIKGGKLDIQRFKYLKEKELQDELRSLPWKK